MNLKYTVKVGQINNLSDARYCAGMGVNYLGFNIDPKDNSSIDQYAFAEITGWIEGCEFVGEFSQSNAHEILEVIPNFNGLKVIETDNKTVALELVDKSSLPVSLKAKLNDLSDLTTEQLESFSSVILTASESAYINNSEKEFMKKLPENTLLGYGFDESNVEVIMSEVGLKGIHLTGGDEIAPGQRDYDELADILEAIEEDF